MPVYFCDPHAPWQRGSNENANGLLRQYFPKRTDLAVHGPEHLRAVEDEINARPRRVPADHTPADLFAELLASPDLPPLPDAPSTLARAAGRRAVRRVTWRHGTRSNAGNPTAAMTSRFLALLGFARPTASSPAPPTTRCPSAG